MSHAASHPECRRVWLALLLVSAAALGAATGASATSTSAPSRALRRELDRDEALLRTQLAGLPGGSGVDIAREPQRVILRIPAALLFGSDSVELKSDAAQSVPLAAAVMLLKKRRALAARISVYSDSIGGSASNLMLTQTRAHHLRALINAAGVAATRLNEHGAGQSLPLTGNDTPEARSLNRRVEIEFAPAGAISQVPATAS